MDALLDQQQLICRACLKIVENKTQSFGYIDDGNGNLKDMMMCCVPEMDMYVSSNPIMCFPCIQLLVTVYNFKTRCLNTETIIRSYIERNNLREYNQVNLSCVIQELIKLNNYFQDVQQRNLENTQYNPNNMQSNQFGPTVIQTDANQVSNFVDSIPRNDEGDRLINHQADFQQPDMNVYIKNTTTAELNESIEEKTPNIPAANEIVNYEYTVNGNQSMTNEELSNQTTTYPINEAQDESEDENRPRLIIKICKNRITLPFHKNEDSNEKENKEMEIETNHINMPPPAPMPMELPQDNIKQQIYQCPNCTFMTVSINYYLSHTKSCNFGEKKCPHCPHITNRLYALNKHINTMHTKLIWYSCDFCPYRSTDMSCLRRHKRNVHPERLAGDLVCGICQYRCTTEYLLKKHMIKHDVNGILQCQFCSYSTKDRSNFRKHIFIHNPKRKGCEFCDYECVSPYQMKLHLKKFHNGVGMEDVDCRSEVSINEVVEDISAAIKELKEAKGQATQQTE